MKPIEVGEKVVFVASNGTGRKATVAYVWGPGVDGNPLLNVAYDGEGGVPIVATSVPHRSQCPGASGYYWERREPGRHHVDVRGEPGDVLSVRNLATGYTQSLRLANPPPEFRREEA